VSEEENSAGRVPGKDSEGISTDDACDIEE